MWQDRNDFVSFQPCRRLSGKVAIPRRSLLPILRPEQDMVWRREDVQAEIFRLGEHRKSRREGFSPSLLELATEISDPWRSRRLGVLDWPARLEEKARRAGLVGHKQHCEVHVPKHLPVQVMATPLDG